MPKLFSKKRSKKAKHSIRDALLPSVAFVAVPSTPPVLEPGSENQSNRFQFPANPSPLPTLPGNSPEQVPRTYQLSTVPQPHTTNQGTVQTREAASVVGTYSLVGPSEEVSDEDSQSEPGYASVRTVPYHRPRLPSPLHMQEDAEVQNHTHSPQATASGGSPSPHRLREEETSNVPSGRERVLSTSELPSVTSGLSVHSNSSESYQLNTLHTMGSLDNNGDSSKHRHTEMVDNRQGGSFIEHSQESSKQQEEKVKSPLTEVEKEGLYTKVVKPKKGGKGRVIRTATADLPPRVPSLSPQNSKRSTAQAAPTGQSQSTRTCINSGDHKRGKVASQARGNSKGSQRPKSNREHAHTKRESKHNTTGRNNQHSQYGEGSSHRPRKESSHSSKGASYQQKESSPSEEEGVFEEKEEYSDEDYLLSCEESDSSIESYIVDEDDGEAPNDYIVNPRRKSGPHSHSRSMTYPLHRPPINKHSRSFTQSSQHKQKSNNPYLERPPTRPASSPFVDLDTHIPVLQSALMQPMESQGEVYVFSQQLSDGSLQYYRASPVHSPTHHTPPPITQPTPVPSHPKHQPHNHTLFHLQHQFDGNSSCMPGIANKQIDGSDTAHKAHLLTGKSPASLSESGYFSNPTLGGKPSRQGLVKENKVLNSVIVHNVQSQGSGITGTLISPLCRQPSPSARGLSEAQEARLSPQVKLLESSLQRVTRSTSPCLSPSYMTSDLPYMPQELHPQASSSPLSNRAQSPLVNERVSPPGGRANRYEEMIAQYQQKEAAHKVRLDELIAVNRELREENSSLKQNYEGFKTESSNSCERLQSRVSTLLSESSSLREAHQDKDSRIGLMKESIIQLKIELTTLSEENKALLTNQQSSLEERGEWEAVAAHAHSVLDENTSLVKSRDIQRETVRQMKGEHQAIVSQLNGEIGKLRKEREEVEETLNTLRQSHTHLLMKFDELSARTAQYVPIEEHQEVLLELQCLVEELAEKNERKARSQEAQMRISMKDKKSLVTKLTDAKAIIYQLEEEVAQLHGAHRKAHEKVLELQHELELARDKEVTVHSQLSRAVMCAEKATVERDTFAKIAKSQEQAKERAVIRGVKREAAIGKMEKSLKSQSNRELERTSIILHEQDREYRHQRANYRREVTHLKSLLAKKQTHVDKLIKDNS